MKKNKKEFKLKNLMLVFMYVAVISLCVYLFMNLGGC